MVTIILAVIAVNVFRYFVEVSTTLKAVKESQNRERWLEGKKTEVEENQRQEWYE